MTIEVKDTGPGLPPDEVAKIFEPFYTTKSDGTGLGLAVSYGIIQQHGGRIEVNSVLASADAPIEGSGTTFTVRLPIQPVADAADPDQLM